MSKEFFVTLEEESDLVVDLGDVNLLWPCAKSEVFLCQLFVIYDGGWWEIDVCADQTLKFMVAVLLSSFKFTILTACGFAQIAWNHCLVDSTSVTFAEVVLFLFFGAVFVVWAVVMVPCSQIVSKVVMFYFFTHVKAFWLSSLGFSQPAKLFLWMRLKLIDLNGVSFWSAPWPATAVMTVFSSSTIVMVGILTSNKFRLILGRVLNEILIIFVVQTHFVSLSLFVPLVVSLVVSESFILQHLLNIFCWAASF